MSTDTPTRPTKTGTETAPMLVGAWPQDLASVVAHLVAADARLAQRLALAPPRALHGIAVWLRSAAAQDLDVLSMAERVRTTDFRDLVREAMPDLADGFIAALGRLDRTVAPKRLYTRLNAVLLSPAAAALPREGVITPAHLRTAEKIVSFGHPLTAMSKSLAGSDSGVDAAAGVVRLLRKLSLAKAVEATPMGSGWNSFLARVLSDLDAARTPHSDFPAPPGWTLMETIGDLEKAGRDLRLCLAGYSYGAIHYLRAHLTGDAVFLRSDDPPSLVMLNQMVGEWWISEINLRGNGRPPTMLRASLEEGLRAAGVRLAELDPMSGIEIVVHRGRCSEVRREEANDGQHDDYA